MTFTYIENTNLSEKDLRWYSNVNHAEATRNVLRVKDDFGGTTDYVVFKKGSGKKKVGGQATDWGDGTVIFASYSRFLQVDKKTGEVLNKQFSIL